MKKPVHYPLPPLLPTPYNHQSSLILHKLSTTTTTPLSHLLLPHSLTPLLSSLSLLPNPLPLTLPLHSLLVKSSFIPHNPPIISSLLRLYSKSHLPFAHQLFDEISQPTIFHWTLLISSYAKSHQPLNSLLLFQQLHYSPTTPPNRVTFISALSACSALNALNTGIWIHDAIARQRLRLDVVLGTALIDMYSKCGRVEDAVKVFDEMQERNVFTWNAVIGGFALAKCGREAVDWFQRMESEGVRPDEVTLIEVLRACTHSGLVELGRKVFDEMLERRFGFAPSIKHYGCMVDLLARAGYLNEAVEMVERMPFEAGVVVWGSVLGGCRAHGDLTLSELAAKKMVEIEPENVAHYVVLANLYGEMERWGEAQELRRVVKERGLRKDAGWSFAEVDEDDECMQEGFAQC